MLNFCHVVLKLCRVVHYHSIWICKLGLGLQFLFSDIPPSETEMGSSLTAFQEERVTEEVLSFLQLQGHAAYLCVSS